MTYAPQTLLAVRSLFQQKTGLDASALGIIHGSPQGGGYHEGNDLLAQGGRLTTDYSKRETDKDRPGSDAASGIDIGYFDVRVFSKRVTLRTLNQWVLDNWNTPDAQWIREMIYSLDGSTVRRADRLGIRTTGDSSHLTHSHFSRFRDLENDTNAEAFFARFWNEMEGTTMSLTPDEGKILANSHDRIVAFQTGVKYNDQAPPAFLADLTAVKSQAASNGTGISALTAAVARLATAGVTQDMVNAAMVYALQQPAVLAALAPVIQDNSFISAQRAERE